MAKNEIQLGDRFIRKGNPNADWIVDRFIEKPDHPLHIRLRRKGRRTSTIIVAATILGDRREFTLCPKDTA